MTARLRTPWPVPTRGEAFSGRKLLLADDDPAIHSKVKDALAPLGLSFVEVHDGPSALSGIRTHRPDLILMDVEMPGLSGVEITRIVKANQGDAGFGFVPVILMTARDGGKVEGLELGADDYVMKPFDPPELAARVKSMLRLKLLQDALVEKNRELDKANRELEKKRAELLALSRTDGLTGLYNRRYFEERLEAEFLRAERYQTQLACLMVDIDHFKLLNDTYGHPFGDVVLRDVAQRARTTLRNVDLIARYGGEEFVALLPETAIPEALAAAERIRVAIAETPFAWDGAGAEPVRVTCTVSIGVATYPAPGVTHAYALLRVADDALYAAKAAGRNRVNPERA